MSLTQSSLTPQTLLEAVNELLSSVRLAGVMSLLSQDLNEDAADAKRALDDASVTVQTEGWAFNTEVAVLDPSPIGEVVLPENTLKVRRARCSGGEIVVQRGKRLYAPGRRSYNINRTVSADLVVGLPFEELPSAARAHVVAIAGRRFGVPRVPSAATFRYSDDMIRETRILLENAEAEGRDQTLPETSPHFAQMRRR